MENKYALQIEARLLEGGLSVVDTVPINYGQQIKLDCGINVNVYSTGKILVQGKLHFCAPESTRGQLEAILPPHTKWNLGG
ncbi:MAG: hypothetical protein H6R18_298 [Proteobacteria bacterium]|nr:hypothetical protein [Pseudomonadota bacterium]